MARGEAPQAREEPAGRECSDHANGQHFAHTTVLEPVQHLADLAKGVRDCRLQCLAFFRKREPAGQSPEELHAQTIFQNPHLLAHGGLRHAKFQPGLGKAEMASGRFE